MKGFLRLTILLLLTFGVTSCLEKGCLDPRASNYAEEADQHNGECEYEGCLKDDFYCQNGGTCNENGKCDCPDGYYGDSCEHEKTPTRIFVRSVLLYNNEFSVSNDFIDPELYVRINSNSEEGYLRTGFGEVPKGDSVFLGVSGYFDSVKDVKEIIVKDDYTGDVARFDTVFYQKGHGFPNPIIFRPKEYDLKLKFDVEYLF